MAKNKRSFFERLTGSMKVDDDSEVDESEKRSLSKREDWPAETEAEGELTVDVFQTADDIVIQAMVAGVKPEDLDISINRDMVTIKGRREVSREVREEDFFFRELYWGAFSRAIVLPQEIEVEESEATERNGLLTVRLPKIDKEKQTKLKVRSGS